MDNDSQLGFSQEYDDAKRRLADLKAAYADLLAYYTDLTGTVKADLEAEYMLNIGRKEHRLFTLQLQIRQVKREIALYQAARNRGQVVSPAEVQSIIAREFAEYEAQLAEQQENIRKAERLHLTPTLSTEDSKAIKKLYLSLVKKLHPDLNPDLPAAAQLLWNKITRAYNDWDWQELNLLADMVDDVLRDNTPIIPQDNAFQTIRADIEKFTEKQNALKRKIDDMLAKPPFSYRKLLQDKIALADKRKQLDDSAELLEQHLQEISELRDMLKGFNI